MTKAPPQNVVTIKFVNKGLDEIHINSIFHSAEVIASLPQDLQEEENIPSCTMKLDIPIRNKILNYQETVASLDIVVDENVSFAVTFLVVNANTLNFVTLITNIS